MRSRICGFNSGNDDCTDKLTIARIFDLKKARVLVKDIFTTGIKSYPNLKNGIYETDIF